MSERAGDKSERFEQAHEAGAERHGDLWFLANVCAVRAINNCGGRPEDPLTKAMAAEIVLRVLDAVKSRPIGEIMNGGTARSSIATSTYSFSPGGMVEMHDGSGEWIARSATRRSMTTAEVTQLVSAAGYDKTQPHPLCYQKFSYTDFLKQLGIDIDYTSATADGGKEAKS